MSGMGLASDGNRLFFVTGNGDGHENAGTPATGTSGCQTLGEAAVSRLAYDPRDTLTPIRSISTSTTEGSFDSPTISSRTTMRTWMVVIKILDQEV